MTATRVHVRVEGKVQGVWYRASARDEALRLGVSGWVRNLPDGGVELLAEGPAEAVDALLTWCEQGPPQAEVSRVHVDRAASTGDLAGFVVR